MSPTVELRYLVLRDPPYGSKLQYRLIEQEIPTDEETIYVWSDWQDVEYVMEPLNAPR